MRLAEDFGKDISASIPQACGDWHSTKAAYRFFDHEAVTSERLLSPHIDATLKRVSMQQRILLVQDTTELNSSSQTQKQDVGPSHHGEEQTLFLHPLLAVTEQRVPLGIVWQQQWYRELLQKDKAEKPSSVHTPIEEKESYRWLLGYRKGCEIAENCPSTQCIVVGDRESDIYDIFDEAEHGTNSVPADWLVRVMHNRVLLDALGKRQTQKLYTAIRQADEVLSIQFKLPKQGKRPAREVEQMVRVARVTLHPPTGRRGKLRLSPVTVTVLLAEEINTPEGAEPIKWYLMTNSAFEEPKQALQMIKWYLCRWEMELYFKVLKSGCQLERIQLTQKERFEPCIALYIILAWRVMYLTMMARKTPDICCTTCFTPEEWQFIYCLINKSPPPKKPPSLDTITRMLVRLGGYLEKK